MKLKVLTKKSPQRSDPFGMPSTDAVPIAVTADWEEGFVSLVATESFEASPAFLLSWFCVAGSEPEVPDPWLCACANGTPVRINHRVAPRANDKLREIKIG